MTHFRETASDQNKAGMNMTYGVSKLHLSQHLALAFFIQTEQVTGIL